MNKGRVRSENVSPRHRGRCGHDDSRLCVVDGHLGSVRRRTCPGAHVHQDSRIPPRLDCGGLARHASSCRGVPGTRRWGTEMKSGKIRASNRWLRAGTCGRPAAPAGTAAWSSPASSGRFSCRTWKSPSTLKRHPTAASSLWMERTGVIEVYDDCVSPEARRVHAKRARPLRHCPRPRVC